MSDLEFKENAPMKSADKKISDSPNVVLDRAGSEGSSGVSHVIEGTKGKNGYTVRIPETNKGSEEVLKEIDAALTYYKESSPGGIQTMDGSEFPPQSPDENPWTISVWTNYGEQRLPYTGPTDWDTFISDTAQHREIDREKAADAIRYVKLQTPFLRFGFEPGNRVKDLSVASTLADTKRLAILVEHVTEGVEPGEIGNFFDRLTINASVQV